MDIHEENPEIGVLQHVDRYIASTLEAACCLIESLSIVSAENEEWKMKLLDHEKFLPQLFQNLHADFNSTKCVTCNTARFFGIGVECSTVLVLSLQFTLSNHS